MTFSNAIRVQFEPLRSLAFGAIGSGYSAIGSPYAHPIRCLKISNSTDANIIVSFDGTTNHDFVSASGFVLYDFEANKEYVAGKLTQATGTQVYIKQETGAPTSGNVYVTVFYAYANN